MNTTKKLISLFLVLTLVSYTQAQQTDVITFDIGSFAVSLLSEGQGEGNRDILIGATDEMLRQTTENGTFPNAVNVFLLQTGNKNVLFDTGFGRNLFRNLETLGKSPADINAVMLTHLHGDHIGGLLTNGQRAFPNAALYISRQEYDYWTSDAEMQKLPANARGRFTAARAVINAYRDNLQLFTPREIENSQELMPGVRAVAAFGHTPGHTAYMIESAGDQLFISGDLVHAPAVQMPFPEVAVTFDIDPAKAVETRLQLLEYLERNDIRVAGMHIPFPAIGTLLRNRATGGYRFTLICDCLGRKAP